MCAWPTLPPRIPLRRPWCPLPTNICVSLGSSSSGEYILLKVTDVLSLSQVQNERSFQNTVIEINQSSQRPLLSFAHLIFYVGKRAKRHLPIRCPLPFRFACFVVINQVILYAASVRFSNYGVLHILNSGGLPQKRDIFTSQSGKGLRKRGSRGHTCRIARVSAKVTNQVQQKNQLTYSVSQTVDLYRSSFCGKVVVLWEGRCFGSTVTCTFRCSACTEQVIDETKYS